MYVYKKRTRLAGGGYGLGGGWATFSTRAFLVFLLQSNTYKCKKQIHVCVKKDTVGRWWVGAGGWWATYALPDGEGSTHWNGSTCRQTRGVGFF